jgi:23S rRNA (guanosine2251-2'-O)-methyltransferase
MNLVIKKNTLDIINELKQVDFICIGSGVDGQDEKDMKVPTKKALFLGNESTGIPRKILTKLDEIIKIEMKKDFDSLNVSVAAGILINRMK